MIVYKVGDGYQDAHGQEVTKDGVLLNPGADPDNLSLLGAVDRGEGAEDMESEPAPPAKKPVAKPQPAKGKK